MKPIGDSCNLPQRLKELATLKASRGDLIGANAVYDEITDLTEGMIASSNTEYAKGLFDRSAERCVCEPLHLVG